MAIQKRFIPRNFAMLSKCAFLLGMTIILQACGPGWGLSALGTGAAAEAKYKSEFIADVTDSYQRYLRFFNTSGCYYNEWELNPYIVDSLKKAGPRHAKGVIAQLQEVVDDESQLHTVRAHALYHILVYEVYRQNDKPNETHISAILDRFKSEFKGSHDCAIEALIENKRV